MVGKLVLGKLVLGKLVGELAWLANLNWANLIEQTGIGQLALDER